MAYDCPSTKRNKPVVTCATPVGCWLNRQYWTASPNCSYYQPWQHISVWLEHGALYKNNRCYYIGLHGSNQDSTGLVELPHRSPHGIHCQHTCAPPSLAVDSSEMGWGPISSLRPTHKPLLERFSLRVHVFDLTQSQWVSNVSRPQTATHPSSRMSGNERCSDMMSLANWLNALFCQPLSYLVLFSGDNLSLSITTPSPFSPSNKTTMHTAIMLSYNNHC